MPIDEVADAWDIASGLWEWLVGGAASYAEIRESLEWTTEAGASTRDMILESASEVPVERDASGAIVAGQWTDPYTGFESTDPGDFDIDHRVPFRSVVEGIPNFADLPLEEQQAHFNDRDNLQVLHDAHNSSKGDATPVEYAERIASPELRQQFEQACERYMAKIGMS